MAAEVIIAASSSLVAISAGCSTVNVGFWSFKDR